MPQNLESNIKPDSVSVTQEILPYSLDRGLRGAEILLDIFQAVEGSPIEPDPSHLIVTIPGLAQIAEDPLIDIATATARVIGASFLVHTPYVTSTSNFRPYLLSIEGRTLPIYDAIYQLHAKSNYSKISIIGHSLGGTQAVAAMSAEGARQLPITNLICLGSPNTLVTGEIPYLRKRTIQRGFAYPMDTVRESYIAYRKIPYYTPRHENEEEAHLRSQLLLGAGMDNLREIGTSISVLWATGDSVVEKDQLLSGKGVNTRSLAVATEGLSPSNIHNWRGQSARNLMLNSILELIGVNCRIKK